MIYLKMAEPGRFLSGVLHLSNTFLGCNETFDDPYGRISSPGWPRASPANSVCEFVISVDSSRTISVYARAFLIRSDANCTSAFLEVRM